MSHVSISNLLNQLSIAIQSSDTEKALLLVQDCHSYVDCLDNAMLNDILNSSSLTVDEALTAFEQGKLYIELKDFIHEDHWFSDMGMVVKLSDVISKEDYAVLAIDGTSFHSFNLNKMDNSYYPNRDTEQKVRDGAIKEKEFYSAYEAGLYKLVDTLYWSVIIDDTMINNPSVKEVLQSLLDFNKVVFKTT